MFRYKHVLNYDTVGVKIKNSCCTTAKKLPYNVFLSITFFWYASDLQH